MGAASHIIKRPRLTKILDETEARIILLCAPAGYGKTTLAREWVATRKEPVLWYSGGPAMADVAALAVHLADLLTGPDSDAAERVRRMASRAQSSHHLARAIAQARRDDAAILVLDDYHFATAHDEPDSLIRELARLIPNRFLITSRTRPSWMTGRAVVYGSVFEIAQQDLAFTDEEAKEILPESGDVRAQAGGWPAVLGLAAFAGPIDLRGGTAPAELFEFLATEIVDALDGDTQCALMTLAAGADHSIDVARRLLGEQCGAITERALRNGLLTKSSDGWIGMHPLLRLFMVERLRSQAVEERSRILQDVLASLREHAAWDSCLTLLKTFPELDQASVVLRAALVELLERGRLATVHEWIQLGTTTHAEDPIFALARGETALRSGDDAAAFAFATEAVRRLEGELLARAHITAARAAHQRNESSDAAKHAAIAEHLATSPELQTEAQWLAFAAAYEYKPDQMSAALTRLRKTPDRRPEHAVRLASAEAFAQIGPDGNAEAALVAAERAVALATAVQDPLSVTNALHIRAHLLKLCGRYADALEAIPQVVAEAETSGLLFVLHHAELTRAGALTGLRALGEARRSLRAVERSATPLNEHVRTNIQITGARLRIAAGDLEGAAVIMRQDLPGPNLLRSEVLALKALVAAALDEDEATKHIEDARCLPMYVEPAGLAMLAETIVNVQREPNPQSAAAAVKAVLATGVVDAVVAACRAFPPLASLAAAGGAAGELERVFASSNDRDLGRRSGLSMPREHSSRQQLSPREREVLELIAAGRTNAEIARTLYIAESTAKVHIRHVFEKLGVHGRAEAVAVAADWL